MKIIRAVIYARFSTELQSDKSAEDQIALCRTFAQREGLVIVGEFFDKAVSGATLHRPGIQQLLKFVGAGGVDIILCEELDRLSRDMGDLATLHKQLGFAGVQLWTVHGGAAKTLDVGMRGLFAQLFREDNVHKIRRGMTGLVNKGLSAGGRAYGYSQDLGNPGRPKINGEEAAVVQHIFASYVRQRSPKAICRELNARSIAPPRGSLWMPGALVGMADRGSGMLRNPIYVGRIVWNKNQMVKDPHTGRRISRPNPPGAWQCTDAPALRIISDELFEAAQVQLKLRSHARAVGGLNKVKRPVHLLTGLLKCGSCGAGMQASGRDRSGKVRLRCSAHVKARCCPGPKSHYLDDVETLFLRSLHQYTQDPNRIIKLANRYAAGLSRSSIEQQIGKLQGQIGEFEESIGRLLEWMLQDMGDPKVLGEKMKAQRTQQDRLRAELATLEEQSAATSVDPEAISRVAAAVAAIRSAKSQNSDTVITQDDKAVIREAIERVTVRTKPNGQRSLELTIRCRLIALQKKMSAGMPMLMISGRSARGATAQPTWQFENDDAVVEWSVTS